MSENHGNHQHGHTKHHFTKYSQYVGIYSPKKVDIPSPKSKKDTSKTEEDESQDYQFDNTSSLWNQLRTVWQKYHDPENKQNSGSDKQLQGFRILINNLLQELGLGTSSNSTELVDITVQDIPKLKFYYSDKDEGEKSS